MADRLTRALAEIQAVLEEQRHEREEAVRQVAELEVSLDAARSQASERERSLMDANSRLLGQVEELSTTVARMQAQVRRGPSPPLLVVPVPRPRECWNRCN